MSFATGVGSMPGDDVAEALRLVLGELPDLPYLPELPDRGIASAMTGRTLGLVRDLGVDLQPAGWRLTEGVRAGLDHRRAQSRLAQDLDVLEELTQGLDGAFKVQVAGPWTLAATVEKPRGDKVLSDHGARRDLAQALAEAVGAHVRDVRRRVPGVSRLVVQIDEPALAAVLGARVPTASGFGRHRAVDFPEVRETLRWVVAAIDDAGAEAWVHSCAPTTPWALVREADARGLVTDLSQVDAAGHDALAEALEAGESVVLGVVPTEPGDLTDRAVVDRVLRWLDMLGLDAGTVGERLGVSGTCGYAGASPEWARRAIVLTRESARQLS